MCCVFVQFSERFFTFVSAVHLQNPGGHFEPIKGFYVHTVFNRNPISNNLEKETAETFTRLGNASGQLARIIWQFNQVLTTQINDHIKSLLVVGRYLANYLLLFSCVVLIPFI